MLSKMDSIWEKIFLEKTDKNCVNFFQLLILVFLFKKLPHFVWSWFQTDSQGKHDRYFISRLDRQPQAFKCWSVFYS